MYPTAISITPHLANLTQARAAFVCRACASGACLPQAATAPAVPQPNLLWAKISDRRSEGAAFTYPPPPLGAAQPLRGHLQCIHCKCRLHPAVACQLSPHPIHLLCRYIIPPAMRALVRGLAASFASAVTMEPLAEPISMELARQQHDAYVKLLKQLLPGGVTELPADDKHPGVCMGGAAGACLAAPAGRLSTHCLMVGRRGCRPAPTLRGAHRSPEVLVSPADCCFIEDTAVVAGSTAVIARIGAASRQGEEAPVAEALAALGCTVRRLQPPATLDGGDVLQLPGSTHILVGLSRRTNAEGVAQLAAALPDHSVHGVPVAAGLHLKSLVTALDASTLLLADTPAGRSLSQALAVLPGLAGRQLHHEFVPDPVCANVLLLGDGHVVTQVGGWGGGGGVQ